MPDEGIDWTDRSEVGARLTAQFAGALARLIAVRDDEGRYDELAEGYRDGKLSLVLSREGLTLIEATPAPPASSRN